MVLYAQVHNISTKQGYSHLQQDRRVVRSSSCHIVLAYSSDRSGFSTAQVLAEATWPFPGLLSSEYLTPDLLLLWAVCPEVFPRNTNPWQQEESSSMHPSAETAADPAAKLYLVIFSVVLYSKPANPTKWQCLWSTVEASVSLEWLIMLSSNIYKECKKKE